MHAATTHSPQPALVELAHRLLRHRELLWEMTKRELKDRYAGQVLGSFWAVGQPLLQVLTYLFIFNVVFGVRVGSGRELPLDYAGYILSGLLPWLALQEAVNTSCNVLHENANLVKQVIYPFETLPVQVAMAAMITQCITTSFLALYLLLRHGSVPWTFGLVPLLMILQCIGAAGAGFLLAPAGAVFKDVQEIVRVIFMLGMYATPIVYLPGWVPGKFQLVFRLNPFSYLIWCYQDICYFGEIRHPWAWAFLALGSVALLGIGYAFFRKARAAIGNHL